jgi:CubicO group peptidase (beta-lactamase class C family)
VDRARLAKLRADLETRHTKALIVARQGAIVEEWYAAGYDSKTRHYTASLAKSLVGGMALLVAINDGLLRADDRASRYIGAWRDDAVRSRITLRHLAAHCSGIEDATEPGREQEKLPGWKGAFWTHRGRDPFSIATREAPVARRPGTRFEYSSPGYAALGEALGARLRGTANPEIRTLLAMRLMRPLGIPDAAWRIGYRGPTRRDGMSLYAVWGGSSFTPRAAARVGQLLLDRGRWMGRELIRPGLVDSATTYAGTPVPGRQDGDPTPAPTLGWYCNFDGVWPGAPRDTYVGAGADNQHVIVIPSLDLVAVRFGAPLGDPDRGEGFWAAFERELLNPLVEAVTRTPYPHSAHVNGVRFGPRRSILRHAVGSDNWPLTWGDDDAIYAAYGDGWGFAPRGSRKLSLGFARIPGSPRDPRGENIASRTGEREGDGSKGLKASGMLMVDSVLYMWVRNARNAQLAWSADHGRTWTWGFRFGASFAAPTFLNFGPNYEGARDDKVYVLSSDGPSAYESYDRLILARVPKDRIRDRGEYEFFVRRDDFGLPVWTKDLDRRGAIFEYPGHCARTEMVFHPGIGRYLLAVGYDLKGGWGLFDAPRPWGPWTTVFHTTKWGLGETHSYRIPTKWIEADGDAFWLVFSGQKEGDADYDAMSVVRTALIPPRRPPPPVETPDPATMHDWRRAR